MLAITYETGQLLHSLITGIKAKDVLELGTSTGYSALWMADALLSNHKNPRITTVESNPAKISRAVANFRRARISNIVRIKQGTIMEVLREMPKSQKFDFVLIDADKENITEYADLVVPRLRAGGIMVTDNMLHPAKYRKIMRGYSRHLKTKRGLQTCTVPIGYGEEITVKVHD